MSVTVYNLNVIKDLPKTIEIDTAGISLAEMIDYLASRYGLEIKERLIVEGKLTDRAIVSLNGITVSDALVHIPDGSQLMLYHVVMGG